MTNDLINKLKKKANKNLTVKSIFYNKYFWEIKLASKEIIKSRSVIFTCPFPQL